MKVRRRTLPYGWYPDSERKVIENISQWEKETGEGKKSCGRAGIAPHAGWFFSGRLAWRVVSGLAPADTIVVLGGHLSPRDAPLCAGEDAFETPCGLLQADKTLRDRIAAEIGALPDDYPDNTVEVQLPLVKAAFPRARVVCLRVPPASAAEAVGKLLAGLAGEGASVAVLGSTDLTHYGPNYGFSPRGTGDEAVDWVRNVNDRNFLDAAVRRDARNIIDLGVREKAACSSGAAAGAAAFAAGLGLGGELLEYATSLDRHRSSSFVGYGAVLYG